MTHSNSYYMLVTSLPHLEPLFSTKQTPISRLKLDQRLALLEPEDAATLARIESLLLWGRLSMDQTDDDVVRRAHTVIARLDSDVLRGIVTARLELRTVVAALRRRQHGEATPAPGIRWGFGRWVDFIHRRWHEPHFGLERVYPWLTECKRLLDAGEVADLERHLLGVVWDQLSRVHAEHHFDFEAVVLYVLRWNIVARWSHYNGEAAVRRFARLVDAGLGEHIDVLSDRSSE